MVAEHVHVTLTFGAALPLIAVSFARAPLVLRQTTPTKTSVSWNQKNGAPYGSRTRLYNVKGCRPNR